MKQLYFFHIILILSFSISKSYARIQAYETTRLKSTAGTGVATPLVDEASILNPSTMAFFNMGAFYFQKTNADLTNDTTSQTQENSSLGFIASDASGRAKGSVSYFKQEINGNKSEQLAGSMASVIGKQSSMGVTYKKVTEVTASGEKDYLVTDIGVSHFVDPQFSMGIVVKDPLKKKPFETRAIVGFQYVVKDYISLMLDAGADYNQDLKSTTLIRAATQLKVYNDFYIRFGASEDKLLKEKSTGAGIGWVQPKLVVNASIKNSEYSASKELDQKSEKSKETSFSLSYRF